MGWFIYLQKKALCYFPVTYHNLFCEGFFPNSTDAHPVLKVTYLRDHSTLWHSFICFFCPGGWTHLFSDIIQGHPQLPGLKSWPRNDTIMQIQMPLQFFPVFINVWHRPVSAAASHLTTKIRGCSLNTRGQETEEILSFACRILLATS